MTPSSSPVFPKMENQDPNLFQILKLIVFHLKKASYYLIFFGAIGLALSLIKFHYTEPVYQSSLTAHSAYLSDKRIEAAVLKLDQMCASKSYKQLAKTLKIQTAQATKIAFFRTKTALILEPTALNYSIESRIFEIIVGIKRVSLLDTLETKLIDYLDNSEYVRLRYQPDSLVITQNLAVLQNRLDALEMAGSAISSTNQNYYNSKIDPKKPLLIADPASIALHIVELYNEKKSLKTELLRLQIKNNVISSFNSYVKYEYPIFNTYLKNGLLIGLLVGLFVYLIIILRKEMLK